MKIFAFLAFATAALALPQDAARSETSEYWASYLQTVSSLATPPPTPAPTPSPTTAPTPFPTPAPTPAPTTSPTGECIVTVELECAYADNMTGVMMPCDEFPPLDLSSNATNCLQEVIYTASACNVGIQDQMIYDFVFTFGDDIMDFLEGLDAPLPAGECLVQVAEGIVDRCSET